MREIANAPWFTALPPCEAPAPVDMSGWQKLRAMGRGITFKAPPGFEPVKVRYPEGGAMWSHGNANLVLRYGRWNEYAFSAIDRKCRAIVDEMPVVEMTVPPGDGTFEQAWFVAHDMLLRLKSGDPKDAKLFPAIVASADR